MGSREGETSSAKVGGGAAGADVEAFGNDRNDVATPMAAAPTRRTLTFPTSEVLRRPSARPCEDDPRSGSRFTTEAPPTVPLRALRRHSVAPALSPLTAIGGSESSAELRGDEERSSSASDVERPSERSTVPTLDSTGVAGADSSVSMIELSVSELESVHEVSMLTDEALAAPPVPRLEAGAGKAARAISEWPRPQSSIDAPAVVPRTRTARRVAVGLLVSHGLVAVAVALVAGSGGAPSPMTIVREPNVPLSERTPLSHPGGLALPPPSPGGCAASGDARVLAPRAQIGPGLDVTVLETGFGVALASGSREAVGIRVEGSGLRIAETVRVKSPTLVSHAVVESGLEEGSDSLDVRVDADDARTITSAGEAPALRIVARGGSIMALLPEDDLRGVRARSIWPLPGGGPVARAPGPVVASRTSAGPKSNPYRPPGFSKLSDAPRPATTSPRPVAFGPELVRAAGRDDGGAVVALRRSSMFYVGVTEASLAPAGPLVALSRKGATVGTPSVAPWGGGGAIAWAERETGEREWSIVVAGFAPDGEGATTLGPVRVIGKGMSPTLAALPDGDLLLAHADGPPGAHRVVAVRLGRDLDPRGEALVVSPASINAGQPALAVRPDGRAIVAFFAADRGGAAAVFATPLACDPGL